MSSNLCVPERPALGSLGRTIQLKANFFPIDTLPGQDIFHYSLSIVPEIPLCKSRKVYQLWETESRKTGLINSMNPIFDGRKSLYTPKELPFDVPAVFQIDFFDPEELPGQKEPQKFKLTINFSSNIHMYRLAWFLDGKTSIVPHDALNFLDVLLMQHPSRKYTAIGRSFYTPDQLVPIANAAQLWQGFHQTLKPTKGQLLINLDVSATTFYEPGPILDMIAKILGKTSPSELRSNWFEKDKSRVERALKGLRIMVTHRGNIKQKFKISKITNTPASKTTFNHNEQEIDVATYFEKRYGIVLKYPHFPCLVVGESEKGVYLPFEVCHVLPAQRNFKKLTEKQTSEMIKFTCQPPHVRSAKISSGISLLQPKDDPTYRDFNVKIGKEMLTVNARILSSPTISYHPASKESTITPREGTWNLRDKMVAQGTTLRTWLVLVFGAEKEYPTSSVQKFTNSLTQTLEECGVYVPNKNPPINYVNPNQNVEKLLLDAFNACSNQFQEKAQLILCVLPNTNVSLYAEIKRVSDTMIGVATQCIQAKHMFAAKRQYCANVCLKVNVKLGGMNSYLPQLPFINEASTMIFGADLIHPSSSGNPSLASIAALVGSIDSHCAKYSASIRFQRTISDRILDLGSMVIELIRLWSSKQGNSAKPERILFYRDGLTSEPFEPVIEQEIMDIKRACRELDPHYQPKLTFIAVQKRHHVRFFPISKEDMDKSGNILPGTVIETGVTHPSEFDFYLCSHPGLQGTSKPTHYHIYYDDNQMSSDLIQDFTYKLCYLYCRATRSVSVCPPAYYAHLVATRARFHSKQVDSTHSPMIPDSDVIPSLDDLGQGVLDLGLESDGSSVSTLAENMSRGNSFSRQTTVNSQFNTGFLETITESSSGIASTRESFIVPQQQANIPLRQSFQQGSATFANTPMNQFSQNTQFAINFHALTGVSSNGSFSSGTAFSATSSGTPFSSSSGSSAVHSSPGRSSVSSFGRSGSILGSSTFPFATFSPLPTTRQSFQNGSSSARGSLFANQTSRLTLKQRKPRSTSVANNEKLVQYLSVKPELNGVMYFM